MDPVSHRLRLAVPKVLQQQLMEETHAGAFSGHLLLKECIVSWPRSIGRRACTRTSTTIAAVV